MENEIREKDKKMNEIKMDIKTTKVEEYKVQLQVAESESTRLRQIIEDLMKSKETEKEKEYIKLNGALVEQNSVIQELRQQNTELSSIIQTKESENNILMNNLKEAERKIDVKSKSIQEYKIKVARLVAEVEELQKKLSIKYKNSVEQDQNMLTVKLDTKIYKEEPIKKEEINSKLIINQ